MKTTKTARPKPARRPPTAPAARPRLGRVDRARLLDLWADAAVYAELLFHRLWEVSQVGGDPGHPDRGWLDLDRLADAAGAAEALMCNLGVPPVRLPGGLPSAFVPAVRASAPAPTGGRP